jgi:Flp pilus assembly protein TadG
MVSRICRSIGVDHGSSMVEFAVASVILFTLVFGVIGICVALYSYNVVAEAAREATRYAIVRGSACSVSTFPDCNVTSNQLQTYVRGRGFPGITSSSLTVVATWPTTGATCFPSVTPCNNPGNLVSVTVSYPYILSIPFVSPQTLRMSSTSAMYISQ